MNRPPRRSQSFPGVCFGFPRFPVFQTSVVSWVADPKRFLYTTYVCNLSIASFMNFQNSQKPGFCNLTYVIKVISFNLCFSWSDRLMVV